MFLPSKITLTSIACMVLANSALANPTKVNGLDELAPQLLQQHDVPSVAVAYIEDGTLAFTRVYGEQSWGKMADEDTLYNVASLTKPIVAEALLRMVDNDVLSLDTPLADFFVDPDVAGHEWTAKLTPELVLRHETGFTNWRYKTDWTLRFEREPGTAVEYSGEGYEWLAKAMAAKADKEFETLVEDHVFAPATMERTAFNFKNWFVGHTAAPYKKGEGVFNVVFWDQYSAADDLRTTIGDFAEFMLYAFEQPVSKSLQDQRLHIKREHNPYQGCLESEQPAEYCADSSGWGLGWLVMEWNGTKILHHTGGDQGEKTIAFYVPSTGQGGAIFTNGANGHLLFADIISILIEQPGFVKTLSF